MIDIIPFSKGEEKELWDVYYSAIRMVCVNDYSPQQIQAWAPDDFDQEIWLNKIQKISPYVAKIDTKIVGYADLQSDGYIDHFFVHGQHQSIGVGRELMNTLIKKGQGLEKLYSHVSLTARPFFEHFGFIVIQQQDIELRGSLITNYIMERKQEI